MEKGAGGMGGGKRGIIYLSLHCHHHDDSCIKMGMDESRLINYEGQSQKTVSTNHNLKRKESRSGIEPRSFC